MRALGEAIRNTRGLLKAKEEPPTLDDVLEGMTAVIHVRIPEPQFTSQTKDELSTAGITKVVQTLVDAARQAPGWRTAGPRPRPVRCCRRSSTPPGCG